MNDPEDPMAASRRERRELARSRERAHATMLARWTAAVVLACLVGGCNKPPPLELHWVTAIPNLDVSFASGLASDSRGATFLTGRWTKDANPAAGNLFVAKCDPQGKLEWLRQAGDAQDNRGSAVATDAAGNCYVTGRFQGALGLGEARLTDAAGGGVFLAKLNQAGVAEWLRRVGDTNLDAAFGVALDRTGNCYVAGTHARSAILGAKRLLGVGGFVAKYNAAGELQWGRGVRDGRAIALDGEGNYYVAGRGVSKHAASGAEQWSAELPGEATALALDAAGSAWVAGGPREFSQPGAFVAKVNPGGVVQWARTTAMGVLASALAVAVDGQGNGYVTGHAQEIGLRVLGGRPAVHVVLLKYNAAGAQQWAYRVAGTDLGAGVGVRLDHAGDLCLSGFFSGDARFGASPLPNAPAAGAAGFIAKYRLTAGQVRR